MADKSTEDVHFNTSHDLISCFSGWVEEAHQPGLRQHNSTRGTVFGTSKDPSGYQCGRFPPSLVENITTCRILLCKQSKMYSFKIDMCCISLLKLQPAACYRGVRCDDIKSLQIVSS